MPITSTHYQIDPVLREECFFPLLPTLLHVLVKICKLLQHRSNIYRELTKHGITISRITEKALLDRQIIEDIRTHIYQIAKATSMIEAKFETSIEAENSLADNPRGIAYEITGQNSQAIYRLFQKIRAHNR